MAKQKDPAEVSGWGLRDDGKPRQDFSDIARHAERNVEFEPGVANETTRGRADGTKPEEPKKGD